ncbi:MAG: acyl carrier protein [Acidobacteria bacterium]|nr:acyl carrier protein [Acidobacteriota bacterium]MCI0621732.1 acyl carrier protein [Acidobacteriota bacterium]MCI0718380.1 acyl carrier protein [Acidobacteriota bacterium]
MNTDEEQAVIISEVKEYIVRRILVGASDGQLAPNESFLQRGILNSTGVLDLVSFIETRYLFRCADEEITPDNLDSLNAIAAFVQRKLRPAQRSSPSR